MRFSVIVPIYKVEKYLNRCIDSVLSQTYRDFELILVDDGSPDNCPMICDEYAKGDSRITVIHKENGGLVSARQAGILKAGGDYVIHLDGDDALISDALETANEIIEKTGADMVSFSYKISTDAGIGETVCDLPDEGLYTKSDMEKLIYPNLLSNKNMKNLFYFLWGKAIKRDLATKHQLAVNPAISMGEDVMGSTPCYLDASTVYMSKKAVYLYTVRGDSITTDFKISQITQVAEVVSGLHKMDVTKPKDFDEQIARYSCFLCFAILAAAAEGNHYKAIKDIKSSILGSVHSAEIKKAEFENITIKSRITIWLMKKEKIGLAFYFLNLCKGLKAIGRGGK